LVIKDAGAQAGAAAARRSAPPVSGRRVWLAAFAAVAALLLARSPFLFTTRLYETADEAANSILVLQAMHFTLLHGNYSLEGFFHPGPAYLYVMAAGQWLFRDVLHLVPTPWNGQLIAILLLNSAEVATVAWIVYRWAGSAWAAAVAVALIIGLAAAVDVGVPAVINRDILGANWMPDMYVPTFLAFVAAAASVAAGRTSHLGLLAATGWLATHGHAEFLFFVPLIVAAAAAAALWPDRHAPWAAVRRFVRRRRSHYLPALAISALFALPIVADLVLHWPGEFGLYWRYARSGRAGHHPLGEVIRYVLWYWAPGPLWLGLLVMTAATAAALTIAIRFAPRIAAASPAAGLPRFMLAAVWISAVTTAGMIFYGARGLDPASSRYVGFFYWSVPLLTFLVIAAGLIAALRSRRGARIAAAGALLVALGAGLVSPALRADVHDNEPALVPAMAAMAARAHGRLIILRTEGVQYDTHGLLMQAIRRGLRACVAGSPARIFAVTSEFICTPRQAAAGVVFWLYPPAAQPVPGTRVIARLRYSVLAAPGTPPVRRSARRGPRSVARVNSRAARTDSGRDASTRLAPGCAAGPRRCAGRVTVPASESRSKTSVTSVST
jgi:hypothetical protein